MIVYLGCVDSKWFSSDQNPALSLISDPDPDPALDPDPDPALDPECI